MVELPTSTTFGRLARWVLPGAVVLMGLALVATVWATSRGVEDASEMLTRGQASVIHGAVRGTLFRRSEVTRETLDELLAQHAPDGLRYIAVFDEKDLIADAGDGPDDQTRFREELAHMKPGELERVGDRVRVLYGKPRRNASRARPRRGRGPRIRTIVLEFEPRIADELRSDARRGVAIGAIAGAALLFIAIAAVRWYMRREALERQLAHERRLASLGEMSAVLAHEIRNPVASLKGNAQLLVKMLPDEGRPRTKAARLVSESERLEALTNDLLEFARAGEIDREPADPAALLRDAAEHVAGGERVVIDAEAAPATWSVDAPRIVQVLYNLLENACQASDERVDARCARDGGDLVYTIRDRGDGIASGDAAHLFEPFFTRKTRGTGLGLAVSRRLVELHGGTITADNHPDGGAVFRVTIPEKS